MVGIMSTVSGASMPSGRYNRSGCCTSPPGSAVNTIDRIFPLRGKQVHLQELADVVAVRTEPSLKRLASGPALESLVSEEALPQIRALQNAGWSFVSSQQATEGAKVYLKSGGRVALGTNRLTVRVASQRSADE